MENLNHENSIEELDLLIKKCKSEKKYTECLTHIEKSIIQKSIKYGKESEEFFKTAKVLCEVCNLIALSCLQVNKKEEGLNYLLKSEKLFKNYKELLNICYNNIGCYYKL
jgi:hypothetical protein